MIELRGQKALIEWDTHKIIRARAEYLLEEYPEDYPDLDAAFAMACEEPDTVESEWEGFTEYLTEILEERNPNGHWYVEMCNFGWRTSITIRLWAKSGTMPPRRLCVTTVANLWAKRLA